MLLQFISSDLSSLSLHLPFHVLGNHVEGVAGPDVTDGVAALVGGAVDGVGGAGAPLIVGQSGVRLQSMTEAKKKTTGRGLLQFLEWPLEAASKSKSMPIDAHIIRPNFTVEINHYKLSLELISSFMMTMNIYCK